MKILRQKWRIQSVDMVTKRSKEIVDNLLESVYIENLVVVNTYDQTIIEIMDDLDCTFSEALDMDFDLNSVDKSSVIDIVDYLETKLGRNLDKVNMLMQIYTHQAPDFKLKPLT